MMDETEDLPPLFPFRWEDYLGFGVAILGLLLAAGGGIGGGGILVPTYILLLDFPVKHAIPLASATVFGGAVANNILNFPKLHPEHPQRSVIDWELITQLEPMTILGALIGAVLNDFLPDLVLVIMMVLLLTVTAYKTLVKAHKLNQQENEERVKYDGARLGETIPLVTTADDKNRNIAPAAVMDVERQDTAFSAEQEDNTSTRSSMWSALRLTALFAVVTALNLFKGGPAESGGGPMGSESCDATCFWVVEAAIFIVIALFVIHARHGLLSRIKRGEAIPSDIAWNKENTIVYPCYAIVAGLVAGLFGVGGGIIKGPLMLALGVHPAVASATSACMILFTSSTATVSYMIFDLLVPDYAIFCLVVGFCSTIVGQTVMSLLLRRYKRNSYIAYSIGFVVAVSAVAMGIESVIAITE
ncbi:MAG: hypothetical protein SGILL_010559 [Bacillariaceae sp.]